MTDGPPLAVLFLPAALAYLLLGRALLWRSGLLRLAMAWFVGQFFATLLVFALAVTLVPFTTAVLGKAVAAAIGSIGVALAAVSWRFRTSLLEAAKTLSWKRTAVRTLFVAACAFFAWNFYSVHLLQWPTGIWKSPVYWDFNVHYPSIQNFVYGDNFPPQNESFAGAPLAYHFFFDLLVAEHVAAGWALVPALNVVSTAALAALLVLVAGFVEELAGSFSGGAVAAVLTLTSSSLFVLHVLGGSGGRPVSELFRSLWENTAHAYHFTFFRGEGFHYNGAMFNVYYFLAERQLVFGTGLLVSALAVLAVRSRLSARSCALAGIAAGLVFFWNIYVALAIGACLGALLLIAPERRKTALLLGGWTAVALATALATRSMVARPEWYLPGTRAGARFDFGFTLLPGEPPPTPLHLARYWGYAYGLKLLLLPLGLAAARRRSPELFFLLVAAIVPAFVLVNCVALDPVSVYDNHKWLRPMNVVVDIGVAVFLASLWARWRLAGAGLAAACLVPLTLSGLIELVPFLRSRPVYHYAAYPTALTQAIRDRTPPGAVFLSSDPPAIHFAGRKVYLGRPGGWRDTANVIRASPLNIPLRKGVTDEIYEAPDVAGLCALARANGIDDVEVPDSETSGQAVREASRRAGFSAVGDEGKLVRFADVKGACAIP